MKRILTGIRPTGNLHIGHFFGTVRNLCELQDKYETFIEIADIQALTDNFENPDKVIHNVRELTLDLLSCGIKANIFIQSKIPEIAELTVIYSNLVTIPRLYRIPTIKTEIKQKEHLFGSDGERLTYGFLGYPVSQAADITCFKGNLIPAGDDQEPLIELCREIIRKFNNIYGDTFELPEQLFTKTPRVKGLDGNEKMGKSLGNAIYLNDTKEEVYKKIMSAKTDTNKIKKDDKANPEVCMVYYYHKLLDNKNLDTVCKECKGGLRGCVACKMELIEKMEEFLSPIREKRKFYEENSAYVELALKKGTKKAKEIAEDTMRQVRKNIKIDYFE